MNSLPITSLQIPLMPKINMTKETVVGKQFLKAMNDFPKDGERQIWYITKWSYVGQQKMDKDTKIWSPKIETVTRFNPTTGKESTETHPVMGYILELFRKDDSKCVVRRLAINAKAGVAFMDALLEIREKAIDKYIPKEEIVLEKVANGDGYLPSILPVGA
jgi:hypothetical protein